MRHDPVLADRPERPASPCINVCSLDARGYCCGCLRSGAEIEQWISMSPAQQWRLVAELEKRRRARGDLLSGAPRAAG